LKRKRTRKTPEIELEAREVFLASAKDKAVIAWCPECAKQTAMDSPERAARLAGNSVRTIYRWVETSDLHFIETPRLLFCLASLPEAAGRN